jgi:RIO kinase 2
MTQMEGTLLVNVRNLSNPQQVLNKLLDQVRIAFQDAKIIHCDLSEYNVIIDEEDQITLFDWPQWVSIKHPNAHLLFRRDISYIINFFRRRFGLIVDTQKAYRKIVNNTRQEHRE